MHAIGERLNNARSDRELVSLCATGLTSDTDDVTSLYRGLNVIKNASVVAGRAEELNLGRITLKVNKNKLGT